MNSARQAIRGARDIVLFDLGPGFFGTIMVSRKCIPAVFALWIGAKTGAILQDKPWDPGITFGSHALKPQHLEDKVFLMGLGVIGRVFLMGSGVIGRRYHLLIRNHMQ